MELEPLFAELDQARCTRLQDLSRRSPRTGASGFDAARGGDHQPGYLPGRAPAPPPASLGPPVARQFSDEMLLAETEGVLALNGQRR
ncbi:MAG: hypothetical protein U5J62_03455 [Desulfurivibrio sp.]|nr:hypothetical protein [Desulfurivibrio sp.]